jgi:SAM-dependent methyltransferase
VLDGRQPGLPTVRIARCRACGLLFQEGWRREFPADLYSYYAKYRGLSEERVYDPLNGARIDALLAEWEARGATRILLDVGCGVGQLVHGATRRGWDALGIDLAPDAIEVAHERGARCRVLDFFASELDDRRFGVIVMSELIEHVPDPLAFLRRARDLLRRDGFLYLTTPNFDCLTRRVRGGAWPPVHPEHLSYFTPETLRDYLTLAGLRVRRLEARNLDLVTLLAGPPRPRPRPAESPPPATTRRGGDTAHSATDLRATLRRAAHGSLVLRSARGVVNRALDATRLGESLIVEAMRAAPTEGAP